MSRMLHRFCVAQRSRSTQDFDMDFPRLMLLAMAFSSHISIAGSNTNRELSTIPAPQLSKNMIHEGVRRHDVLCGRGGATNNHYGNRIYRELVRSHQPRYLIVKKNDKSKISRKIVSTIRERGGRFLRRDTVTDSWVDVGDKRAAEKTSQALREGLDVRSRTGVRQRRNSESSIEDGPVLKRRKLTTCTYDDSPALVSLAGDSLAMPDLEEEINEKIMPQFIYHSPPVSTDDCDDVAQV